MTRPLSFGQIHVSLNRLGLAVVETPWYLNLIGIRSAGSANAFDDRLALAWFQDGRACLLVFTCTTDPGLHWRRHPITERGTAILKPGHYPGLWSLGLHRGQYEALVQRGPCTVFRDSDRDGQLDTAGAREETGLFGINCHRAAEACQPTTVGRWSAGCQVLPDSADFGLLLALARKHISSYGNRIGYTLIEEKDLWTP